jgi:hypothetical protein
MTVSQTVERRVIEWLMNNELERIWKETVAVCFNVLSLHFPGGTKETHENLRQVSRSPGRYFNPGSTE